MPEFSLFVLVGDTPQTPENFVTAYMQKEHDHEESGTTEYHKSLLKR